MRRNLFMSTFVKVQQVDVVGGVATQGALVLKFPVVFNHRNLLQRNLKS